VKEVEEGELSGERTGSLASLLLLSDDAAEELRRPVVSNRPSRAPLPQFLQFTHPEGTQEATSWRRATRRPTRCWCRVADSGAIFAIHQSQGSQKWEKIQYFLTN